MEKVNLNLRGGVGGRGTRERRERSKRFVESVIAKLVSTRVHKSAYLSIIIIVVIIIIIIIIKSVLFYREIADRGECNCARVRRDKRIPANRRTRSIFARQSRARGREEIGKGDEVRDRC
jgi:hypothetical protein